MTSIRASYLILPVCAALAACGTKDQTTSPPNPVTTSPSGTNVTKAATPAPKAEGGIKETRGKRRQQLAAQPNG